MTRFCYGPGCDREADPDENGLCDTHARQLRRSGRLTEIRQRPSDQRERLREAALTYAEAEEDDEFRRAEDNLEKSAQAFARRHVGKAISDGLRRRGEQGQPVGRPATGTSRWAARRRRRRG